MTNYGKELILDIHDANPERFTRPLIKKFWQDLCEKIAMEACEYHFWDDLDELPENRETEPHLVGTSGVMFIKTSNITIHTLDIMRRVYLNVFSCKDFDAQLAIDFSLEFFQGRPARNQIIDRL
jgi:S-adenosylmethionine decarboxylase